MNLLFVCSENRLRSPTAAAIFGQYEGVQARSAGLGPLAETTVSRDLIAWADVVLVMEPDQQAMIEAEFPDLLRNTRLVCLDIPDRYAYMEPELVELLERKVPERVELP